RSPGQPPAAEEREEDAPEDAEGEHPPEVVELAVEAPLEPRHLQPPGRRAAAVAEGDVAGARRQPLPGAADGDLLGPRGERNGEGGVALEVGAHAEDGASRCE